MFKYMENLITPKRITKISIRLTIESLENGQSAIFSLLDSENAIRQAASRAKGNGRKYPVKRTPDGFLVTRIDR